MLTANPRSQRPLRGARGSHRSVTAVGTSGMLSPMDLERERLAREYAFRHLEALVASHGDVLRRSMLAEGFVFHGTRIPLISQRGIWKPRSLELPVSITTSPKDPYGDEVYDDGFLHYRYFGDDPAHPDNAGLRTTMELAVPLVYFHGVEPGWYQPVWPALIHHDDPGTSTFTVALEDPRAIRPDLSDDTVDDVARAYTTSRALHRLHQTKFRTRVLTAYRDTCAVCRLRDFPDLLDAAHIKSDATGGLAQVSNGLALCKIHHAAFDRHVLGIRPDYVIEFNREVLRREDGPMLQHGLQGAHRKEIHRPYSKTKQPDRELLEERYELFRAAS